MFETFQQVRVFLLDHFSQVLDALFFALDALAKGTVTIGYLCFYHFLGLLVAVEAEDYVALSCHIPP